MRIFNKSTAALFILTALSLSIGWGIRGNFGHEYGAMIPGALAAMAAVLLSGREDWWRRIHQRTRRRRCHVLAATRLPPVNDKPPGRRWTEVYAVVFLLVGVTYLNLQKNPAEWVRLKAVPETLYGLSAGAWFNVAYLAIAIAVTWTLTRHLKSPLPLVPAHSLGKGQLLYLIFLWWMVVGNFDRAQASFTAQRLVTEGVIHLNAVLCTVLLLLCVPTSTMPIMNPAAKFSFGDHQDDVRRDRRDDRGCVAAVGSRPGDLRRPIRRPCREAYSSGAERHGHEQKAGAGPASPLTRTGRSCKEKCRVGRLLKTKRPSP